MDNSIGAAILLLRKNDYAVIKLSKYQRESAKECEEIAESGGQKDCFGCPCSACVVE